MPTWLDPKQSPPDGAVLDYDHPLTAGLVCALIPDAVGNRMIDFCRDRSSGIGTVSSGSRGPSIRGWTVTNAQWHDLFFSSGVFTVACFANVITVPASAADFSLFDCRFYVNNTNNGGWALNLCYPTTGYAFEAWHNDIPSLAAAFVAGGTVTIGDHLLVGRFGSSGILNSRDIWVDGIQVATTSIAPNPTPTTNNASGSSSAVNASEYVCYAWNRILTISEIAWLTAEPFPFFRMSVARTLISMGKFASPIIRSVSAALLPAM